MADLPRFVFVVHALSGLHRRIIGVRTLNLGLATGVRDGSSAWDVAPIARLGLRGAADGVVIAIPMDPQVFLVDQERALARMQRAVEVARNDGPVHSVGLGSLCAVVAGRGEGLAERLDVPVTTGAAATAWALHRNARTAIEARGGPVAVIGVNGPVGRAVAAMLSADGIRVRVDGRRGGRGLDVESTDSPAEAAAGCPVVVGAGTTGRVLDPAAVMPGAVVVDVALPSTLSGPTPRGVQVVAGEAVTLPPAWYRNGWGHAYHLLAGYGPAQVFACLVEPLVLAAAGRTSPWALGRKVEPDDVAAFGEAAEALGFRPRLAVGWFGVSPRRLGRGQAAPAQLTSGD